MNTTTSPRLTEAEITDLRKQYPDNSPADKVRYLAAAQRLLAQKACQAEDAPASRPRRP